MKRCFLLFALIFLSLDCFAQSKGLINNFEIGYKYPIVPGTKIVYKNLGIRKVNTTNPIEFTYSIGYKFKDWISLSVGSGLSYELTDLRTYGDKIASSYSDSGISSSGKYSNIDIPLFLNARLYPTNGMVRPIISLSGGMYVLNSSMFLIEGGVGCNFKFATLGSIYIMATASMYPSIYGNSGEVPIMGRKNAFAPGLKIGFSL